MIYLRVYRTSLKHGGESGVVRHGVCRGARYFLLAGMLIAPLTAHTEHSAPYIPTDANVVLQLVPPTTDPRVRHFEQLRADFQLHPKDVSKAVALARAYIDYGRSTGDARYLGRAMAIIEPIMAQSTPPISVMLVHATILQSRHDFESSRKELDKIFQRDPGNAQAWLTLATVAMVQGDDGVANNACVQLANASSDFMGMMCTASLRSLTGRAGQAYELMSMVENPGPKAPPEIRAWVEGLMAETAARMGNPAAADAHFKSALQWAPGDNFLLADYGEFLIDQGRAQDAINLVEHDTQSDTSFLVLVSAESALGSPRTPLDAAEMDARFESMDQRGDHVFLREESSYLLHVRHEPKQALALAKQDWTVQRSPKDVRVNLEAAIANHDAASAESVLAFISRTHLSDVTIAPLVMQLQAQASAQSPALATRRSP
jgi:hypothetical protein